MQAQPSSHPKHQHAPIISRLPKASVIHHWRTKFIEDVMPCGRDITHPKPLDLLIAILHLLAEMQRVEGEDAPGGVTFRVVAFVRVFIGYASPDHSIVRAIARQAQHSTGHSARGHRTVWACDFFRASNERPLAVGSYLTGAQVAVLAPRI